MPAYTEKVISQRHIARGNVITKKRKAGGYDADKKENTRDQWSMHVIHRAELYLTSDPLTQKEIDDYGFQLIKMWDYQFTIVKCLPIRDALYRGEISGAEYVMQCARAFHKMSDPLIMLGASDGIPLAFIVNIAQGIRDAQELIVPAPAELSSDEFNLLCDSDNLRIQSMYREIVQRFLVRSNG